MKKNGIFADMQPSLPWEFAEGIEEETGIKWDVISYVSNDRSSHLMEVIRYCKYFYYAFLIFIRRNQYDKIITWQQFYGLIMAAYCRLFRVKKRFSLIVMTFIYKKKQGRLGDLYHSFMQFALNSKYIDKIIVYSQNEVNYYANLFCITEKFVFIPLGIEKIVNTQTDKHLLQQKYILSVGQSNRDYQFLYEALKDTVYRVKILAGVIHLPATKNIEIHTNIFGKEMLHYLHHCFCVVIPLADTKISSGQLAALQAMQSGKPVIVTESDGIADYVVDGYNGMVIKKEKEALTGALHALYSNDILYNTLSQNALYEFEKKYSIRQLGHHVGCIFNS